MVDLLIFGGQSNMQGQTECDPRDKEVTGAKEFRFLTKSFVPLKNPVGEDIGEMLLASHLGHGSLVPYFAESYREKTKRDVICVHVAKGATVISQWLKSDTEGKDRYAKLIEKVTACRELLREEVGRTYFIWLQGESDALSKTTEDVYLSRLRELKKDLEEDLGIDKFMIIEVGYFASHFDGKDADEAIQRAQEKAAEENGFAMLTDIAKELSLDFVNMNPEAVGHFNNASMKTIGKVAGEMAGEIALKDDKNANKKDK